LSAGQTGGNYLRKLNKLIDVHSHAILPFGYEAPMAKQPDWSEDIALAMMDKSGIATSILSVPHAANVAEGQEARDIARRVNESLACMVQRHPTRFGAMACLPGRDPDSALAELEYALDVLKMDGVSTSTNINDVYLGEAFYNAWFEEMDHRGATLFIHPTLLSSFPEYGLGLNPSGLEFMFDTTRMLANMVITGAKRRFPNINMIATHAGGVMPFLVQRLQIVVAAFGPGRGRDPISKEEVKAILATFYYDLTAATTNVQLTGLLDLVPASQLLMGVDIPFMPQDTIPEAIDTIANDLRFSDVDLDLIAHGNAARLYPAVAGRLGL
jgi:predicted TIM-barrel fold metal-dependent hydrolase